MSIIHTTAAQLADLCAAKNAAYGDSVGKSVQALTILYPDGLRPDQYLDALLAARDFDKRSRLAQEGADPHGEDPRLDIAGYALMAIIHQARKAETTCASASAPDAEQPSNPTANASAPLDAPSSTTPPANAGTVSSTSATSSSNSASSSAPAAAAPAPVATADAPSLSAVLEKARAHRERRECATCAKPIGADQFTSSAAGGEFFYFCTRLCRREFHLLLQNVSQEAA